MADRLSSPAQVAPGDLDLDSSAKQAKLGAEFVDGNGRHFRYCLAGATALVPGKLQQAAAEVTTHQGLACAAAAIGASSATVTLGATNAATADQYAEGYLVITIPPGQGYVYKISSHPAAAADATLALALEDPIEVALTTASKADLVTNPYSKVIVNPTTATSAPVGGAITAVTAAQYGFILTKGVCPLLVDDQTVVVGTNVAASNQAAGAVEPHTGVQAIVGIALTGGATTDYVAVQVNLV